MNCEWVERWREVVMTAIKVLFWNLPGETE